MATADEGSKPEAGNPQNQDQEVHDTTRLSLDHVITGYILIRDSDDSINLDDVSKFKELMVDHEGPESNVSILKQSVTEDQVKVHLHPISPKVASPAILARDHPKTHPSQSQKPSQSSPSSATGIVLDQLCSLEGPLFQMVHKLLSDHLQTFTAAMEHKTQTDLEMITQHVDHKLKEVSREIESTQTHLTHLAGVTPPAPWFPGVDEAKKGEKLKQPEVLTFEQRMQALMVKRKKEERRSTQRIRHEKALKDRHDYQEAVERVLRQRAEQSLNPQDTTADEQLQTSEDNPSVVAQPQQPSAVATQTTKLKSDNTILNPMPIADST